jgi:hypothetical protein
MLPPFLFGILGETGTYIKDVVPSWYLGMFRKRSEK